MINLSAHLTRKRLGIALVLGVLLALAFWRPITPPMTETVRIEQRVWSVEIADTPAERTRGLGYRDRLCTDCGMLFVFDTPNRHSFWMKGMRFPLDLVFIDGDRVLSVERRVAADDPRVFTPPAPVTAVLEVNAGGADGIEPGAVVVRSSSLR